MAGLRDKAKKRMNQEGPGVARLIQREVAKSGQSRHVVIQTLERRGRIKKVGNGYQLVK